MEAKDLDICSVRERRLCLTLYYLAKMLGYGIQVQNKDGQLTRIIKGPAIALGNNFQNRKKPITRWVVGGGKGFWLLLNRSTDKELSDMLAALVKLTPAFLNLVFVFGVAVPRAFTEAIKVYVILSNFAVEGSLAFPKVIFHAVLCILQFFIMLPLILATWAMLTPSAFPKKFVEVVELLTIFSRGPVGQAISLVYPALDHFYNPGRLLAPAGWSSSFSTPGLKVSSENILPSSETKLAFKFLTQMLVERKFKIVKEWTSLPANPPGLVKID